MSRGGDDRTYPEDADADIRLILDAYHAWESGDIRTATAHMHPDVEWIEPDEFADGGRYLGPAAVAAYLARSRARWRSIRSSVDARRVGETVAVRHHLRGEAGDGTSQQVAVADIFTVRDGRIVRMEAYVDPDRAFVIDRRGESEVATIPGEPINPMSSPPTRDTERDRAR